MLMFLTLLAVSAENPPATTATADKVDPVICKRSENDTGTHMRAKSTCLPKSQWDYLQRQAEREMRDPQSKLVEPSRAGNRTTPQ